MFKRRNFLFLVVFIVWIFLLPIASLGVSSGCLLLSAKVATKLQFTLSRSLLKCSNVSSLFALKTSETVSALPLLSKPYSFVSDLSQFVNESTKLFTTGIYVADTFLNDPTIQNIENLAPYIDKLSRDAQILSTDSKNISLVQKVSPTFSVFQDFVKYLPVVKTASTHASELFGGKAQGSSYLILFQNNMELRPTGGFIGSFGLFDLKEGKKLNSKIYDVYDADGQLSGFIAPPAPIRNYLGEASWYMRDSNWDPDFSTSARRALWFLDKTLNKQAIGVIGVDVDVLKRLLAVTGPVKVLDYGDTVNEENFYQKIQTQVESNFFPGSTKKKNYLTALSNSVFDALFANKSNWKGIAKAILESLQSRDIQFYFTNEEMQFATTNAQVGGVIGKSNTGFIEANLGVNKANQYISRTAKINLSDRGDRFMIQELTFTNNAKENLPETTYKVYLRSLAPKTFQAGKVHIVSGGLERDVLPDIVPVGERLEAGTFISVKAGESATVSYTWSTINEDSMKDLVFWKQAGVASYPLEVSLSLTNVGETKYNTQVSKDINLIP